MKKAEKTIYNCVIEMSSHSDTNKNNICHHKFYDIFVNQLRI